MLPESTENSGADTASPSEPQSANDCFLCAPNDKLIFWSNRQFLALAGLGPITEGYSLVAARAHVKSMADVAVSDIVERDTALESVRKRLENVFGQNCVVTEHGRIPVCKDENDQRHDAHCFHAHFLLFPNAPDVSEQAESYFRESKSFGNIFEALEHAKDCPEYFLVSPTRHRYKILSKPLHMPRQLARGLVAHALGVTHLTDWRTAPNWADALRNAERMSTAFVRATDADG